MLLFALVYFSVQISYFNQKCIPKQIVARLSYSWEVFTQ